MRPVQALLALIVAGAFFVGVSGRASADPFTTTRASNGAWCTADMIYSGESTRAPYFVFRYEGPHGIATTTFRLGSFFGYPAVYAERVTLGNGTNFVLAPFGSEPAALFGTTTEYEIDNYWKAVSTGRLSLFAVGADVQSVLRIAVKDFCEEFDPAYFAPSSGVTSTPTPTPTATPALRR